MRYPVFLSSALAMGALAGPLEKRVMVTEIDLTVVTVTVFVTPGRSIPTPMPTANANTAKLTLSRSRHGSKSQLRSSSSTPKPSAVTVAPTSIAASPIPETISAPALTSSSYVLELQSTAPIPSIAAASSQALAASSQVPAASSALTFGVDHVSGEVEATLSSGTDYQNAILWHHNRARANHGANYLQWSAECEAGARKAAKVCDFSHSHLEGLNQGQNLWAISGDKFVVTEGITESWYRDEAESYSSWWGQEPPHNATDPSKLDMDYFEQYGHMTQVVWKATTHVGCVSIDCSGKMTGTGDANINKYTVCNYSPSGNTVNAFAKNVVAPIAPYSRFSGTD